MKLEIRNLRKRRLYVLAFTLPLLALLLPAVYLGLRFTSPSAKAAWYDDLYAYRTTLTITHNATVSNTRVQFDLDTATQITAGRLQSDCGDSRFTDATGRILRYYIDTSGGACNGASTDYHVLIPTINNGSTTIYHYFGNPGATNGTESQQLAETLTTPSGGAATVGSLERGSAPIAYWGMNEAVDNRCPGGTDDVCDSTLGSNGGTRSGALWRASDYCVNGSCLWFDGSDDVVTIDAATQINFSDQLASGFTFSAWIRPNGAGEGSGGQVFFKGTNTWLRVDSLSNGWLDIEGSLDLATSDATLNVSTQIQKDRWTHVAMSYTDDGDDEITLWVNGRSVGSSSNGSGAPAADANALLIGGTTTSNFNGFIDEVRLYAFERTSAQMITAVESSGSVSDGTAARLSSTREKGLSDGLVAYLSMEETAANSCTGGSNDSCDRSGNGLDGAWNGNATVQYAREFPRVVTLDGSGDYIQVSDASTLDFGTGDFAVNFWVYKLAATTGGGFDNGHGVNKWNTSSSAGTNEWAVTIGDMSDGTGDNPQFYIESSTTSYSVDSNTALTLNSWQMISAVRSDTTLSIYVNGVLRATTTIPAGTSVNNVSGRNLRVGAAATAGLESNARFAQLRIYNRALTTQDITRLYTWAPAPVGYWNLDENTGTSAYDSSGNGNTGTLTSGPLWTRGRVGSSTDFDGADDLITVSTSSSLQIAASFTIAAWIYPDSWGETSFGSIFSKFNGVSAMDIQLFVRDTNDNLGLIIAGGTTRQSTANVITLNTWQHVAVTYDMMTGGVTFYVNGVTQGTATEPLNPTGAAQASVIGNNQAGTETFDGRIDDFRLYNYARNPIQIVEDMNAGHPVGGSPIGSQQIYWKFDEGFGTTAYNAVDTATDGTLSNMASPATTTSGWTQTGRINRGLLFDGSNDAVTIATASDSYVDFASTETFTLSTWMYMTTAPGTSDEDCLICKWDATSTTRGYRLYLDNDDADSTAHVTMAIYDESADQTITVSSSTDSIATNTWYHVSATFSGSTTGAAGAITLYLNGQPVGTSAANASFLGLEDVTADFTVGDYDTTDATAANTAFTGTLDEVQVYNSQLTSNEILLIANANATASFSTLGSSEASTLSDGAGTAPIAWYSFNENAFNTCPGGTADACDQSGNAFHLSSRNAATRYDAGYYGSAIYLSAAVSGVDFTYDDTGSSALDLTGSFTLQGWIKSTNVTTGGQGIIVKHATGANNVNYSMGTETTPNGDEIYCDYNHISGTVGTTTTTANLTTGRWYFLTCVHDATANTLTIFIDGIQHVQNTSATQTPITGDFDFFVGGDDSFGYYADSFYGYIDEVKVYNYARSQAQILYDYNRGKPHAWWKFDECTGTTANDASGNSYSGTITPGSLGNTSAGNCSSGSSTDTWYNGATGKYSSALDFDGSDDYVTVSDTSNLRFDSASTDFSVFSWIRRDTTGEMNIISKEDADNDGWRLLVNSSNAVVCSVDSIDVTSSLTITDSSWHHVGCTIDRNGNGQIYIDGLPSGSATAISSEVMANTSAIRIGTRSYTSTNYFNGLLDDIRIYNYALSASQVKVVYNEGAGTRFAPATGSP